MSEDTARTTLDDLTVAVAHFGRTIDYLCERFDRVETKLRRRIEQCEEWQDDLASTVKALDEWRCEMQLRERHDLAAMDAWASLEEDT